MGSSALIGLVGLTAVDDPTLSQLSTAGVIFVILLFVGLTAAVAIPIWRRNARRRRNEDRLRRAGHLGAPGPVGGTREQTGSRADGPPPPGDPSP